MENRWADDKASEYIKFYGDKYGEDFALRLYTTKLLGYNKALVLHGGGNTSLKGFYTNAYGEEEAALYIKASGTNMASAEPENFSAMRIANLKKMRSLCSITDDGMINEFRAAMFNYRYKNPSLETLVHAFLPFKYIDHTHPDNILILTNQTNAKNLINETFGDSFIVLDYITPGFKLARAVIEAFDNNQNAKGIILMNHGLITWGQSAKQSYDITIDTVKKAGNIIKEEIFRPSINVEQTSLDEAYTKYIKIAPILRGLLTKPLENPDNPYGRVILKPIITNDTIYVSKHILLTTPVTTDYLIRTKAYPLYIEELDFNANLNDQLKKAIDDYANDYEQYVKRHLKNHNGLKNIDNKPRIVFVNGIGAICAGEDETSAQIACDITAQTVKIKSTIDTIGTYKGLSEDEIFAMEYRSYQHLKLNDYSQQHLAGRIALITGAAGAIGTGICRELVKSGCHVVITDLDVNKLNELYDEYSEYERPYLLKVQMDVTDPISIANAFKTVIKHWGGIDIIVVNAGIAMVSKLIDMDIQGFQRLEKVNVEGTLNVIKEGAVLLKTQSIGGDIILISTKNVFSPGAGFGAYSATKAASHQLARIASLELAADDIRVNMVSPDAVFSDGKRRSGLWETVGPDRMRARGLDEKGLEQYYQNRNLLKAKVTPKHVANAVLFFATRQTPTTGATIPVDGGLPDSTPR
ncbi:MAG: bifunctional aldolase/short-chain dehydrogenase [Candidatus Magnetoovum sp. WYHC-5]|nr:bifunctional aldolase/short-chain dehydrogenase [Candidatus Magnetoovum sp. WYHC-5]